jgi:hypothetical protein
MITLITAIIAVMIVAIAIVVTLRKGSVPPATPAVNSVIAARALISVPNPPSGLSPEEIKARQALLIH